MKTSDLLLGLDRDISRRDFVHGTGLTALGLLLPAGCTPSGGDSTPVDAPATPPADDRYPPVRTGMRGSHPGSFEVAHALAREGAEFEPGEELAEDFDLIVVGSGISGLTAAYAYRQRFGPSSRILILDNHDDFGGHAKRNEFHQGGEMRLAWGGSMNLEYLSFSDPVMELLAELGIDPESLASEVQFDYGDERPSIFFDEESYGVDRLVTGFSMYDRNVDALDRIDAFPIPAAARSALQDFLRSDDNLLDGWSEAEIEALLYDTNYLDFLREVVGLPEEAIQLFEKATDGYWGVQPHSLSTSEVLAAWLPGAHRLGAAGERANGSEESEEVAMFPDGNASVARLLVRSLIPEAVPGEDAATIASASVDYAALERPGASVQLRLNSTAVRAENVSDGVAVTFVRDGTTTRARARHAVLACYHSIIPYLCPELGEDQTRALSRQVKHPMLVTNVLIRDGRGFDELGISGAYCPGRMHAKVWPLRGVDTGGYRQGSELDGPTSVMFWGMVEPPRREAHIHDQLRDARRALLELPFEAFEREVRTVLTGLLGPAGFNAAEDILAITVNRWPHGYAYGYLDLWDPEWPEGEAPHEIARRPVGRITIANSDAAASAYAHAAIEEALRAVAELPA